MKTQILSILALLGAAFVSTTSAQSPTPPTGPSAGTVPSGGGITGSARATSTDISAPAPGSQIEALFQRLDTNHDGYVTLAELRAGAAFLTGPGATPGATNTGANATGNATGSANAGSTDVAPAGAGTRNAAKN
jgi:hypothetical protein